MTALFLIASLAMSAPDAAARDVGSPTFVAEAPQSAAKVAPLARDTRGRPTIDAQINGRGPFPMVVDTAAQTSLLTPDLAREVDLPVVGDMELGGVSGQQKAPIYGVDRFATGLFDVATVGVVALPNVGVTDARGVIGMEHFSQSRILFDNTAGQIAVTPSGEGPEGYVAVAGRLNASGLVEVPVEIDGIAFTALIDTGAAVSVASSEALKALGWATTDPRLSPGGQIRGATDHQATVLIGKVGTISLGPVNFRDVPVVFPDPGGSDDTQTGRPSLILGSDLLNGLDAFALDFGKARMEVRIPR
ncbi:aspartyl protease family protein [uncultured Brevundimonas sp.]|uniref:aspartyl protease family protein n=1 Tax=uncultured Brevundimonas sp. TaxID=213418 RepID=UPI0025DA8FA3|nr:aspartyl protease family protein [uncultured Brevundimonas sp.]